MAAAGNVIQIERVRCLDCSTSYSKPSDGGTVHENPGCPRCGYLGWLPGSDADDGRPAPIRLARKR